MKKTTCRLLLTAFAAAVLFYGCAKQGYPSGGPKDETPPVVLGTTPPNGTTQFDAKEFLITFDEYVQVRDAENNILVSPPMQHKPEYSTKGRGILVRIKDTLQPNTTYLFQFKEGIADFNEGNPLKSFEYVFSTGTSIDSMTLRGNVLDAFTGKPSTETVTVVAYAQSMLDTLHPDSTVAKQQPLYMTRCDKEGNFQLNHLRDSKYLILAYEDADKNLRLGTEEPVAFLDTLVIPSLMPKTPDTTAIDTTKHLSDSSIADTTAISNTPDSNTIAENSDSTQIADTIPSLHLLLSHEKKEKQRIAKSEFKHAGLIEINTICSVSDSFAIEVLSDSTEQLYIKYNPTRDTLTVWTATEKCDSIVLRISDTNLQDTVKLQYRNKKKGPTTLKPTFAKSLVDNNHPYFDTLWFAFTNPVVSDSLTPLADSAVEVFAFSDSTSSHCGIRYFNDLDSTHSTKGWIDFKGTAGQKYKFSILPNVFTDIYGHSNTDTLTITTEYTKTESYGNIILTITRPDSTSCPLLVQLTTESGNLILQKTVIEGQQITFPHLKAGKYAIRAIVDSNTDGEYTPGNYWQHRQPERILQFGKTLELRENWDMEEKWELKE